MRSARLLNRTAVIAACLMLSSCGNKGDLFLPAEELTPEQRAILENPDAGTTGVDTTSDPALNSSDTGTDKSESDAEQEKQKKAANTGNSN